MNLPVRVFIESPYAGDRLRNEAYAVECMLDSIARGEAPYLSHLLYPRVLKDEIYEQRQLGLLCAAAFRAICEKVIVCTDLGISPGMLIGMDHARSLGIDIVLRKIYNA